MHYYTHNIGDYAIATSCMTFEEKGVYVDMVDRYISTGKPLDTQWLSIFKRRAGEDAVNNVLTLCFVERDGFFYREELDKMIAAYAQTTEKNRRNAQKRRKDVAPEPTGLVSETQTKPSGYPVGSLTINHKPINQEPIDIERADALSAQAQAPASTPVRTRKRPSSACPYSADTVIPEDFRDVAEKAGVGDPQACFAKFVNHALSHDRRLVDWKAGFRTWCANEIQYHPNQQTVRKPLSQLTAADYSDWLS